MHMLGDAPGGEAALEIILACARHSSGRREQQPVLSFDQGCLVGG